MCALIRWLWCFRISRVRILWYPDFVPALKCFSIPLAVCRQLVHCSVKHRCISFIIYFLQKCLSYFGACLWWHAILSAGWVCEALAVKCHRICNLIFWDVVCYPVCLLNGFCFIYCWWKEIYSDLYAIFLRLLHVVSCICINTHLACFLGSVAHTYHCKINSACGNLVPLYSTLIFRYINSEGQVTVFRNRACRQYLCLIRRSPIIRCHTHWAGIVSCMLRVVLVWTILCGCFRHLWRAFSLVFCWFNHKKCGYCSQCSYYRNNYKYCYYPSFIVHRFSSSLFIYVTMYRQSAFMQQNISYNHVIFKYLSFFRKY